MAILSQAQAILLIQQPANGDQLLSAAALELRVKLHAQAIFNRGNMQSKYSFFKEWVQEILPPDKVEGFCALWQAPNETTELVKSIFGELARVWNSENPYTDHKFKSGGDLESDFVEYLDSLNDEKFWKEHYWKEMQTDQNSVLVVDLPALQTTARPAPYVYIMDESCVIDANVNKDGVYDYLIAWSDKPGVILVLDDISWQLFQCAADMNGNYDLSRLTFISQVFHNVGRPACKPLYFDPVSKDTRLINNSPITGSLGRLDWLLFFEIADKYLETYAPFPIYATYSEINDAEEITKDRGEEHLTGGRENMLAPGETFTSTIGDGKASNFKNRKLVGPGTIQRYDAPKDKEDSDLLQNPVQVIPAETTSLEYCKGKLESARNEIFSKCVGRGGDVLNNQAANELQVQSTFESRINVLGTIRNNIEEARKYVYEFIGTLRYGNKQYLGTDVSMGDVYYLITVDDQQNQLKGAKDAGMPVYEIQNQIQAIYRNKYRDQPQLLARNQILAELEPYPGQTIQEVADLVQKGYASETKLRVKIDFEGLIRRFEREQMNIVDFASARPLGTKVDIITQKLIEYVGEDLSADAASKQVGEPGAPNSGGAGGGPLPTPGGEGKMGQGQ